MSYTVSHFVNLSENEKKKKELHINLQTKPFRDFRDNRMQEFPSSLFFFHDEDGGVNYSNDPFENIPFHPLPSQLGHI